MWAVIYEEQNHFYDYIAGVFSTKDAAEAAKEQFLATDPKVLERYSIHQRYVRITELPERDVPCRIRHSEDTRVSRLISRPPPA